MGSHNIHGGLLKAKEAIGVALRNFEILALQEADVAANISFKSHGSFPPDELAARRARCLSCGMASSWSNLYASISKI